MSRALTVALPGLLIAALGGAWLLGCASEAATVEASGLFGPCGSDGHHCTDGLACLPSRDDPAVFTCTRGCVPAAKCPDAIAVGECRALLECGQGCCEINNVWTQSDTTITCSGDVTVAVLSDGYCQPWR